MRKYGVLFMMILSLVLAGCSRSVEKGNTEESTYIIENGEVSVVDYYNLDFVRTLPTEPTEDDIQDYIDFCISSYEAETGEDLGDNPELSSEIIAWITENETTDEEEFYVIVKETLSEYENEENFYYDMNEIYAEVVEASVLNNYTEAELEEAKQTERTYVESLARYNDMDVDAYKESVLNLGTKELYENYIEENALETIKSDKVITAIAEKEGITVSEDEFETYINSLVSYYGYDSTDDLFEVYTEDQLRNDILYDKVLEYIYNLY